MGWIVGIQSTGATLALVVAGDKDTRLVRAVDASLEGDRVDGKRRTRFMTIDLGDFTRLDSAEARSIAQSVGIPQPVADVQSFYCVEHAGRRIVVPSQMLIYSLVGGTRAHRSALLSPAGFQTLSVLTVTEGTLGVTYPAYFEKKPPDRSTGLTQTILWTGAYPSARRMHSSVLRHALAGRFDLDLAKAKVTMSFSGLDLGDGALLAVKIRLATIEPLEQPMPHAIGVVQARFDFTVVDERRLLKGTGSVGPKGPKGSGVEADLADGRYATALTDAEWDQVRSVLSRHRAYNWQLGARERDKIDIILRKLSTGVPWTQVAGSVSRAQLVQRYFRDIEANGSWTEVKDWLLQARGPVDGASRDVSTAQDKGPAGLRRIRTSIAKMTQPEFAALLQVSARTVSGWERGEREPKGEVARRLRLLLLGGVEALRKRVG